MSKLDFNGSPIFPNKGLNEKTNGLNQYTSEEANEVSEEDDEEYPTKNPENIALINKDFLQTSTQESSRFEKFLGSDLESDNDSVYSNDVQDGKHNATVEQINKHLDGGNNNKRSASNLDYIMNYKKQALKDLREKSDENELSKKFLFSRKKFENQKNFSVGTSKESGSMIYNNQGLVDEASKDGLALDAEKDSNEFSIGIFKKFEKLLKALEKLRDLDEEEQLVKLLPPKKFRLKIFLEKYTDALIIKYFDELTDYQLLSLKQQYESYYLKFKRFSKIQRSLLNYQKKLTLAQDKKFEIVPFTPGCAPWNNGRKYLTINKHGVIWIETKTSTPIITFKPYDKSIKCNYRFEVQEEYDLAYLNSDGLLLARSGYYNIDDHDIDINGLRRVRRYVPLCFKSHKNSKYNNLPNNPNRDNTYDANDDLDDEGDEKSASGFEFNINVELWKGEFISTISMSNETINVFINSGIVKRYSCKTGFMTAIEKTYPVIASLGNDKILFNIHLKDSYSLEFLYTLKEVNGFKERYILQNNILNISTEKIIENMNINGDQYSSNLTTFELLRGLFFNDIGNVCIVDNNEFLYILLDNKGDFSPMLNILEAFNDHNNSHDNLIYFPISLTANNLQVIIIKDVSLEKKWNSIQNKINFCEKQTQEILKEIELTERLKKAREKNNRKKKIEIADVLKDNNGNSNPDEKILSKREKINNDILLKNRKVFENKSSFILEQNKNKDVFNGTIYNFPGFPVLPALQNFKINVPISSVQHLSRKTAFNDPRILANAEKEGKSDNDDAKSNGIDNFDDLDFNSKMDKLFGTSNEEEEEENSNTSRAELNDENDFNKMISFGNFDSENLKSCVGFSELILKMKQKLEGGACNTTRNTSQNNDDLDDDDEYIETLNIECNLRHDKNMLCMFNELVLQGRWRLAFALLKNLRLKKSIEAAAKVVEAHISVANKKGEIQHKASLLKFKRAIEAWYTKYKRNYRKYFES